MSSNQLLTLPVVPLRDMVVFPHMMAPFVVGRKPSVTALEQALRREDGMIFLVTQRDPKIDNPGKDDVFDLGVTARVVQHLQLASGNIKVMVEGLTRAEIVDFSTKGGVLEATVRTRRIDVPVTAAMEKYMADLTEVFKEYAKLSHHLSVDGVMASLQDQGIDQFADILPPYRPEQLRIPRKVSACGEHLLADLLGPAHDPVVGHAVGLVIHLVDVAGHGLGDLLRGAARPLLLVDIPVAHGPITVVRRSALLFDLRCHH